MSTLRGNFKIRLQAASNEILQLRAQVSSLGDRLAVVQTELNTANASQKMLSEERNSALLTIDHMQTSQAGDLQAKNSAIQDLEISKEMLERNVQWWQEQFDSANQEVSYGYE